MRTLDRYLLREMSVPFLIGLGAFLIILCFNMVYFTIDLIASGTAEIGDVLLLILLRIPFFLVMALPVASLLAASLALNRITRDRELLALRLAGLPGWRIALPYAIMGALLSTVAFCTQELAAPTLTHASDAIFYRIAAEGSVPALTPDTFFRADNRVFYFRRVYRIGPRTLRLEDVMMFQMGEPGRQTIFPEIWTAREAIVDHKVWTLKGVVMHYLDDRGRASVDAVADHVSLDLSKNSHLIFSGPETSEEMTAAQLHADIQKLSRIGLKGPATAQLRYDYQSRFALPLTCLFCAVLGIPLNMRYARLGGFFGFLLALICVFVYYNAMLFARSFAYSNSMPPEFAAWLPDGIIAVVCLVFMYLER